MQHNRWVLATAPTVEPVTLDEIKSHCRVDLNEDDVKLATLAATARDYVELTIGRALVTQSIDTYFDNWQDPFLLPWPSVQSITTVKYRDLAGVQQTLASTVYQLTERAGLGAVQLAYNQTWPTCRGWKDDIVIRHVAGYGTPALVPYPLKLAILMLTDEWYEHREASTSGAIPIQMPLGVETLLAPLTLNWL